MPRSGTWGSCRLVCRPFYHLQSASEKKKSKIRDCKIKSTEVCHLDRRKFQKRTDGSPGRLDWSAVTLLLGHPPCPHLRGCPREPFLPAVSEGCGLEGGPSAPGCGSESPTEAVISVYFCQACLVITFLKLGLTNAALTLDRVCLSIYFLCSLNFWMARIQVFQGGTASKLCPLGR